MLRIAIIGATGIVGQQAIVSLTGHPWFKIGSRLRNWRRPSVLPGKIIGKL
jgi:Semialdehyde dehydrogenase, NAD binding domain.